MLTDLLNLLFWSLALIISSSLLDRMWSYALARWVYLIFAAPGIAVHELSHLIACYLTDTKVSRVVLMSRQGGSVAHGKPRWGFLGQTIISVAPFVGIPLVLLLIGAIFDLVPMFHCDMTWGHRPRWDVGSMVVGTFSSAFDLIWGNLVGNGSFWFLIFLYLAASMTVALAPSKKDLGNSWLGTAVLVILLVLWAALNDLFLSDLGWEAPVSYFLIDVMGWIVALGLVMCLLGLIVGLLPFLLRMALMERRRS